MSTFILEINAFKLHHILPTFRGLFIVKSARQPQILLTLVHLSLIYCVCVCAGCTRAVSCDCVISDSLFVYGCMYEF